MDNKDNNKLKFKVHYNKPIFKVFNHRAITCFISAEIQTASDLVGKVRLSYKAKAVSNIEDGDEFNEELGKKIALLRAKVRIQEDFKKLIIGITDYVHDQGKILEEDCSYTSYNLTNLKKELEDTLAEAGDVKSK